MAWRRHNAFYDGWWQYISDSDSSGGLDESYTPRDEDPLFPPGTVGGGTPWEPPFPPAVQKDTTPTVLVFNEEQELRQGTRPLWINPDSDPQRRSQTLQLYNRRVIDSGAQKVVVGHRINPTPRTQGGVNNNTLDVNQYVIQGCRLRFPYWYDGDKNNKFAPKITFEFPWKRGGAAGNNTVTFQIYEDNFEFQPQTDELTFEHVFNTTQGATGLEIIPEITFLGLQLADLPAAGWYAFHFTIYVIANAPAAIVTYRDESTNGHMWMCTGLKTNLPQDLEFEFKRQINWKATFPMRVKLNSDRNVNAPVLRQTTVNYAGPLGHRDSGNVGVSYTTKWVHDVYSDNPDNNVAFWWEAEMAKNFQYNYESGLAPFLETSKTVGPSNAGGTTAAINYYRQELAPTQNIPYPAAPNGNRIVQTDGFAEAMTWFPKSEVDVNLSIQNTWYITYNSKALIWLKRGVANNDLLNP